MKLALIGFAAAICVTATPMFGAQTWSGFLVDYGCYAAAERNVNPKDTDAYVDRDRDLEVRSCSPNAKTKSFAIVDHDSMSYRLDSDGNAKASKIARQTGKKEFLQVTVRGERNQDTIRVDSIALVK